MEQNVYILNQCSFVIGRINLEDMSCWQELSITCLPLTRHLNQSSPWEPSLVLLLALHSFIMSRYLFLSFLFSHSSFLYLTSMSLFAIFTYLRSSLLFPHSSSPLCCTSMSSSLLPRVDRRGHGVTASFPKGLCKDWYAPRPGLLCSHWFVLHK